MKRINKTLLVAGAVTMVGVGGLSVQTAAAMASTNHDSLIDKIAQKFNLNKDEVKSLFEEERTKMKVEHEQKMSQRLRKLVERGKITAEQKALIEAKHKELKQEHETAHAALEKWAETNKVDMRLVMGPIEDDERLQEAVDNGEITAEQKTLIEQKRVELKKERETKHTELQTWAKEKGIDITYLHGGENRIQTGGKEHPRH